MSLKKILIIGGGPAGMMAAASLAPRFEVHLFEKEKTIARKFLVAGKGGFNLTNQANGKTLIDHYTPSQFLQSSLMNFDSLAFRQWLKEKGIPTFVGTSGRVFPEKGIKPVQVLQKIKDHLIEQKVQIHVNHEFMGFETSHRILVKNKEETLRLEADFILFALGGASWPKTGSTGDWLTHFKDLGVSTKPFQSSNCGVNINWPDTVKIPHAGKPLKNIALTIGGKRVKGEALITDYGLEGNAIYPLISKTREELDNNGSVKLDIDFKPNNTVEQLLQKVNFDSFSTKDYSKLLNLAKTEYALIKAFTAKTTFSDPSIFIPFIKKLPIVIESLRPVSEAISTVGGIDLSALNPNFSLKKYPHIFVFGEMLDWDAPTGGFLLQACFSMGHNIVL